MIDVLKEISGAVLFDEQILMKFVGKQKLRKVNKTTGVKNKHNHKKQLTYLVQFNQPFLLQIQCPLK